MTQTVSDIIAKKLREVIPKIQVSSEVAMFVAPSLKDIHEELSEISDEHPNIEQSLHEIMIQIDQLIDSLSDVSKASSNATEKVGALAGMVAEQQVLSEEAADEIIDAATIGMSLDSISAVHSASIISFLNNVNPVKLEEIIKDGKIPPERLDELRRIIGTGSSD